MWKKGKYNIGHVTINLDKYKKDSKEEMDEHIQTTGYFRCRNCNSAGKWEITNDFRLVQLTAVMSFNTPMADGRFSFGENRLFDGSSHKYGSNVEEYLLNKILGLKEDSFLWNRLGNSYFKGDRPDLAVCAYEHSLSLEPMQTESLFSLGMILEDIEPKVAANFYHRMLISANQYTKMKAEELRDLLSNGLRSLMYLNLNSNGEISVIPPISLYEECQIDMLSSPDDEFSFVEGNIDPDNLASFYPFVEIFMGKQRDGLPRRKVYFARKKKKQRKKRN